MKLVAFRSGNPAGHLACDEVLLRQAESGERGESLRVFEIERPAVILGIGACWQKEVERERCRADGVPILRRCSGGGAVVVARGCLNYSLVLDTHVRPRLRGLHDSYRVIVGRLTNAFASAGIQLRHAGLSDLAAEDHKVGGSAQKRLQRFILHHGTILYAMDLDLMARYLPTPPDQPDYRAGRPHHAFVANLDVDRGTVETSLAAAFSMTDHGGFTDLTGTLADAVTHLATGKYAMDEWTYRR